MPWTEPPTNATRKEKQGQSAAQVDKLYNSYAPSNPITVV